MDNISILSWNVRGLNCRARRDTVRTMVEDARASIVCLQETKLDAVTDGLMLSMMGIQFRDFAYLPANGTCGGVLIAAKQSTSLSDIHIGCFSAVSYTHLTLPTIA